MTAHCIVAANVAVGRNVSVQMALTVTEQSARIVDGCRTRVIPRPIVPPLSAQSPFADFVLTGQAKHEM